MATPLQHLGTTRAPLPQRQHDHLVRAWFWRGYLAFIGAVLLWALL